MSRDAIEQHEKRMEQIRDRLANAAEPIRCALVGRPNIIDYRDDVAYLLNALAEAEQALAELRASPPVVLHLEEFAAPVSISVPTAETPRKAPRSLADLTGAITPELVASLTLPAPKGRTERFIETAPDKIIGDRGTRTKRDPVTGNWYAEGTTREMIDADLAAKRVSARREIQRNLAAGAIPPGTNGHIWRATEVGEPHEECGVCVRCGCYATSEGDKPCAGDAPPAKSEEELYGDALADSMNRYIRQADAMIELYGGNPAASTAAACTCPSLLDGHLPGCPFAEK